MSLRLCGKKADRNHKEHREKGTQRTQRIIEKSPLPEYLGVKKVQLNIRLIYHLISKEMLLEWRQKYAINGIVLYVFSTLFIIFISFQRLTPEAWITLYWIVILFASVNAGAKSFIQEGRSRQLYYYTISSPQDILLSKLIYNIILLIVLSLLTFFGFSALFGNIIDKNFNFLIIMLLGSVGFAAVFTMISAIASKAKGSATLMTILSFPIIIPQMLLLIKLSKRAAGEAIKGLSLDIGAKDLTGLLMINLIVIIVSYMLFPYLWRE